MITTKINDLISDMLKKEMFNYNEQKNCYIKAKQVHSSIGLQEPQGEVFIRKYFMEKLAIGIVEEVLRVQKELINEELSTQ